VLDFCIERDWEQYHDPKNLSMSIAIEAAELMELFQWLKSEESLAAQIEAAKVEHVKEEVADIVIYAIRMSQVFDFDLMEAVETKIKKNEVKYPAESSRGKSSR
jgi:NTP pyrophosphatase (non-canonical NTP hydrolase)